MDILITHGGLARSRSLHLRASQIIAVVSLAVVLLIGLSGLVYHFIFIKAAQEGWPVVGQVVGLVMRDEVEQRDRYMRENLDAMARKVGEMHAKLVRLESMGERVSGLAGLKPEDLRAVDAPSAPTTPNAPAKPARIKVGADTSGATDPGAGRGGPYRPADSLSFDQLNDLVAMLDNEADRHSDVFTLIESRLLERRLQALVVPSIAPVDGPVGSGFGFRIDPFNGRPALHTGLDYPNSTGTPIHAAAGGVVRAAEAEAAYGMAVEIDHGNGLATRYAHTSKILVKPGDLIKRGQVIAHVGNTGRSTGPHLHFEVLLDGVPQNPQRFLSRGDRGERPDRVTALIEDRPAPARKPARGSSRPAAPAAQADTTPTPVEAQ
jgi:murein DD-endopeptidase MepM/ murein hydrolase activator NlpD